MIAASKLIAVLFALVMGHNGETSIVDYNLSRDDCRIARESIVIDPAYGVRFTCVQQSLLED